MTHPGESDGMSDRLKRDARAEIEAALLRFGHSPGAISQALKIVDAGGSVYDAMKALTGHES